MTASGMPHDPFIRCTNGDHTNMAAHHHIPRLSSHAWGRKHAGSILIVALVVGAILAMLLVLTVGNDPAAPSRSTFDTITAQSSM